MARLSGVGVKARVATAKRLGLDAHGTTPTLMAGGQGRSSPDRLPRGERGESRGAKPRWARAEGPLQAKKQLPKGQALSEGRRPCFGGKASPRA